MFEKQKMDVLALCEAKIKGKCEVVLGVWFSSSSDYIFSTFTLKKFSSLKTIPS